MDEALRPDLSRILQRPWLRQLAEASPLATARPGAPASPDAASDFLVDVTTSRALHPDDVGFGLAQAQAVATRLATRLQHARAAAARLHELDPGSLATRLGP